MIRFRFSPPLRLGLTIGLLLTALSAAAQPTTNQPPPAPEPGGNWLNRGYEQTSEWVSDTAEWIDHNVVTLLTPPQERRDPTFDSFLGNREVEENANRSSVRIRPGIGLLDGENPDYDIRFSARIHLPRSENRANLIIANFEEDENVLEDFRTSRFDQTLREQETQRSIQLQADLRKTARAKLTGKIGMSFRPEPVPKVELRLRTWYTGERIATRLTPAGFWDGDDGFGLKARYEIEKSTSTNWLHRLSTSTLWSESSEGVDAGQTYSIYFRPSKRRAYSVHIGCSGKLEPYQDIDLVSLRFASRRLIHSNWIYLEVEPGVQFPRERDWKETPFFNLQLEFILGALD